MAIFHDDIIDIQIRTGTLHRSFSNKMIGGGDEDGNHYGLRLWDGNEPVSLSNAACVGYLIRADGSTLIINGGTYSNIAYVVLPKAAYAVEGNFTLAIKVSGTGFADTMRIVDGTVVKTTTGNMLDPASEVPSLESLMAVISRAETAAAKIDNLTVTAAQITGTRYRISVTKAS